MAVIGVRAHHGVVDILPLLNKGYDDPARVSQEEPDILFPRQVLWRDTGSAEALATRERSPAAEHDGMRFTDSTQTLLPPSRERPEPLR